MDEPKHHDPVEAALQSLEGLQRAKADEALLQKIEARIQATRAARQVQQTQVRRLTRQMLAASVLMLLLNSAVWFNVGFKQQEMQKVEQFSRLYFTSPLNY
ncbi:hypothetical protein [Haliscomenobacter sp.]|uniref:hypothetical protein n=1 Tax=Haliscomenobacter sp. TaxID=2717303 RepID=UPI0035940DE5